MSPAGNGGDEQEAQRVARLNLTSKERTTLLHCIRAGEDRAIEHFGDDELERVKSIKSKLGYEHGAGFDE